MALRPQRLTKPSTQRATNLSLATRVSAFRPGRSIWPSSRSARPSRAGLAGAQGGQAASADRPNPVSTPCPAYPPLRSVPRRLRAVTASLRGWREGWNHRAEVSVRCVVLLGVTSTLRTGECAGNHPSRRACRAVAAGCFDLDKQEDPHAAVRDAGPGPLARATAGALVTSRASRWPPPAASSCQNPDRRRPRCGRQPQRRCRGRR